MVHAGRRHTAACTHARWKQHNAGLELEINRMEQTARVCNPEQVDYLQMFAILPGIAGGNDRACAARPIWPHLMFVTEEKRPVNSLPVRTWNFRRRAASCLAVLAIAAIAGCGKKHAPPPPPPPPPA